MDLPAFIAAAARRTRSTSTHRDPLLAARQFIDQHGTTLEGQALRKMLKALTVMRGDFAESELFLFSTESLTLVKALVEARIEGRYAEADWLMFSATGDDRPEAPALSTAPPPSRYVPSAAASPLNIPRPTSNYPSSPKRFPHCAPRLPWCN
jgi:hypothetical protein